MFAWGICPVGWSDGFSIDPKATSLVVPATLLGSRIRFRTTVILRLEKEPSCPFFIAVYPSGGIDGAILRSIWNEPIA